MKSFSHYLPGGAGMMMLAILFFAGALIGSAIEIASGSLISPDFAARYGTLISYPVMFVPPMLYARHKSRMNKDTVKGYALDSCNFGRFTSISMALMVSLATLSAAFATDILGVVMPPMPDILKDAMKKLMDGPLWITLISVSVFAPFFEEWLCRGMILRGMLKHTNPSTAIIVSAVFFAVIHLNIWQALAAFILGSLFGFVYYKTGSLKLTMLMHSVNNTFAVIIGRIDRFEDVDSFVQVMSPWAYVSIFLLSLAIIASAVVLLQSIKVKGDVGNCDQI